MVVVVVVTLVVIAPLPNVVCLTMLHDRGSDAASSIPFKLCCGVQLLDDTSVMEVLGLVLNDERMAAATLAAVVLFKRGSVLRL